MSSGGVQPAGPLTNSASTSMLVPTSTGLLQKPVGVSAEGAGLLSGLLAQNGALVLVVTYGRDMKADKFKVEPDRRLDDNDWHDVYFRRRKKQVPASLLTTHSQTYRIHWLGL